MWKFRKLTGESPTHKQPPEQPYKAQLEYYSKCSAVRTVFSIADFVPKSVEGMPFACQYVLEEVIKMLHDPDFGISWKSLNDLLKTHTPDPEKLYKAELEPYVRRIASQTVFYIINRVPESVEGMPYAHHYVLEETIKILQDFDDCLQFKSMLLPHGWDEWFIEGERKLAIMFGFYPYLTH